VVHEGGTLHIPPVLSVRSDTVFRFLLSTFPESGSRDVNPKLDDYLQEQIEQFGDERVFSYRARSHLGQGQPGREVAICMAFFLAGLVWIAAEASFLNRTMPWGKRTTAVWIPIGISVSILAGFFGLLFWLTSRSSVTPRGFKGWQQASLIISPLGVA